MINNSFYINVQRGTIEGCELVRQTLLYILAYWLHGEGAFYMKYSIIPAFLTFSKTVYR